MRFDNSELIRLKKRCEELDRLTVRREDCRRYLKGLEEKQPELMKKLMKETGERDTMSQKMSSSTVYSWFNKKQFLKEMEEADEAERIYAQAGADYERVLRELEKAEDAIEERKNAREEYSDCHLRTLNRLKAVSCPASDRIREIAEESSLAEERKKAIEDATQICSGAIRTAAALAEPIPQFLKMMNLLESGLGFQPVAITQSAQNGLLRYEEGLRNNLKDIVFVLRKAKLSFGAEDLPAIEANLREAIETFFAECKAIGAGRSSKARNAVRDLKRYSDEIGSRLLRISDDMREGAADCERRIANLKLEEEDILLSEIEIPENGSAAEKTVST